MALTINKNYILINYYLILTGSVSIDESVCGNQSWRRKTLNSNDLYLKS